MGNRPRARHCLNEDWTQAVRVRLRPELLLRDEQRLDVALLMLRPHVLGGLVDRNMVDQSDLNFLPSSLLLEARLPNVDLSPERPASC